MPAKGKKWKQLEREDSPVLKVPVPPAESGRRAGLASAARRRCKREGTKAMEAFNRKMRIVSLACAGAPYANIAAIECCSMSHVSRVARKAGVRRSATRKPKELTGSSLKRTGEAF